MMSEDAGVDTGASGDVDYQDVDDAIYCIEDTLGEIQEITETNDINVVLADRHNRRRIANRLHEIGDKCAEAERQLRA